MLPDPETSSVPDWENISLICKDLQSILDEFTDDGTPIPFMKVRLARTIAQLRAEKGMEDRMRLNRFSTVNDDTRGQVRAMAMDLMQKLKQIINYREY